MTITVPTLVLVLPVMAVWVAGYYVIAAGEWNRQVDELVFADEGLTPWRFVRGLLVAIFCGFFWPIALMVAARGGQR